MKSVVLKTRGDKLSAPEFKLCLNQLQSGQVVVLPTDTVYGIGCNAFHFDAVKHIYRLKGRSYSKPLPLLIGDVSQLSLVAQEVIPEAMKLIEAFWPGPLTLVFKTAPLALVATRGRNTVAVRIPNHNLIRSLSKALGVPLATTSANPSGKKSVSMFSPAKKFFSEKISFMIDGGTCSGAIESSVVDVTHYPFTIIREGALSKQQILDVLAQ